ncbi:MAG: permease [Rubrivivax sp.]
MLSRLQRWITIALVSLTAGLVAFSWALGWGWSGLIAAACVVPVGYALALALEFMLMHAVNAADPAPRARAGQVLRAWAGEVASGPIVFGWRQPWRSARWPDRYQRHEIHAVSPGPAPGQDSMPRPDALHSAAKPRRGVLLVHGFVCSRGIWNPWLRRLDAAGVPFIALDLEPVFGSIDAYLPTIEQGVRSLEGATGVAPVVVAHSMGGIAVRRWWAQIDHGPRIHHLITIGTPHFGTWLARWAFTENGHQMRRHGPWLAALQALEASNEPARASRVTCFYGNCDNIVFPASTATLPGADNRHLEAVAHVRMADRSEPFETLQARLGE